jgi:hypothetical protein
MKYSNNFERDYNWYLKWKDIFNFSGSDDEDKVIFDVNYTPINNMMQLIDRAKVINYEYNKRIQKVLRRKRDFIQH